MHKKTTISDIARKLNITPATVSRALNDHPKISAETKKLVKRIAEKLHYRPNKIASSLRSGKTNAIGVIIPSAEIKFFGSVIHGIESIANLHGYNILIYQSNEIPEYELKAIDTFYGARVDGILASIGSGTRDYTHYQQLKNRQFPLVLFDRASDELDIPSVVIDDFKAGFQATEHLILQGYKRIAHIAGPLHVKPFKDRQLGYSAALEKYKFDHPKSLIREGNISVESGQMHASKLLDLPNPPDAFFTVEDFTAMGVIKEAKKRGIRVPEELGVFGFANETFAEHITPSLSSVDQRTVQMGHEAFSLLLSIINNKPRSKPGIRKIVLDPILLIRESSVRIPVKKITSR